MAVILALVLIGFLWWISKASGLTGEAEPQPGGGIQGENTETVDQ